MLRAEEVLTKVNKDNIIKIMEEIGSPLYKITRDGRTGQDCLWFTTVCHGGDSHKLCYFSESKDFFCYTSCGRMTFWEFIKRVNGFDDKQFYKAVKFVADILGIKDTNNRFVLPRDGLEEQELIKQMGVLISKKKAEEKQTCYYDITNKPYDSTVLGYFDHNTFYEGWINEGISIDSMKKYGIAWYDWQRHIIIPHYDIDGNLIGIRRRSLNPEDAHNKYMPEILEGVCYEHSLGMNLYGLYQNKEQIIKTQEAIIVEGEKSVLLSDTYYGDKSVAVATCGFNISANQFMLLKKLGVSKVYLGFDKDFDDNKRGLYINDPVLKTNYNRYKEKINNLAKRCYQFGIIPMVINDRFNLLGEKDSPFDKGKEVLEKLISKSIYIENS